jgi:hypothetical protein
MNGEWRMVIELAIVFSVFRRVRFFIGERSFDNLKFRNLQNAHFLAFTVPRTEREQQRKLKVATSSQSQASARHTLNDKTTLTLLVKLVMGGVMAPVFTTPSPFDLMEASQ